MHIHDFWENGVKWRITCDKKAVGNKLESVDRSYYGMSPQVGKLFFPRGLIGNDTAFPLLLLSTALLHLHQK